MWYLVALLLVLGGWVAAAAIAASDWNDLKSAEVTILNDGKEVPVTERGVALFTDITQDRDVTCRSTPPKAITLEAPRFELTTEGGDRTWHLLSVSKDAKAGDYRIDCTPRDRMSDTATYGYAELPDFRNANTGNGVGSMATFTAVIIAGWCWWGRRTERKLASYESA